MIEDLSLWHAVLLIVVWRASSVVGELLLSLFSWASTWVMRKRLDRAFPGYPKADIVDEPFKGIRGKGSVDLDDVEFPQGPSGVRRVR